MLRGANEVCGWSVAGEGEGVVGHLADLYVDDRRWTVRYLVVDTSRWALGRSVLISPRSITEVELAREALQMSLSRSQVAVSPSLDRVRPVSCQHMEAPAGCAGEALRSEKGKVFRSIRPLTPERLVRGQFRGYRTEEGVAPDSRVETFAAVRLRIDSWRWEGVPFLRAPDRRRDDGRRHPVRPGGQRRGCLGHRRPHSR